MGFWELGRNFLRFRKLLAVNAHPPLPYDVLRFLAGFSCGGFLQAIFAGLSVCDSRVRVLRGCSWLSFFVTNVPFNQRFKRVFEREAMKLLFSRIMEERKL